MAISQTNNNGGLSAREIIRDSQDAYAMLSSYSDDGTIIENLGNQTLRTTFKIKLQRPDFYRIEWSQAATPFFTNSGVVWSAGNGNVLEMKIGQSRANPEKYPDMQTALATATGVSGQAASTIPGTFFKQHLENALNPANATLQGVEHVNGVDCYVISRTLEPITSQGETIQKAIIMLWIGKKDHLIHRIKTVMEKTSMKLPQMSDAEIKKMLEVQNEPATPQAVAEMKAHLTEMMKRAQKDINSGTVTFTQTHENISVNRKFSAADFAPQSAMFRK